MKTNNWSSEKVKEKILQSLYESALGKKKMSDTQIRSAQSFLRYSCLCKKLMEDKEGENFFGTEKLKFSTLSTCCEEFFWSKKALFGPFLGREG